MTRIAFRPFDKQDFDAFAGAEDIRPGQGPIISEFSMPTCLESDEETDWVVVVAKEGIQFILADGEGFATITLPASCAGATGLVRSILGHLTYSVDLIESLKAMSVTSNF